MLLRSDSSDMVGSSLPRIKSCRHKREVSVDAPSLLTW